jgi:DHA1 family bicyclomycin/chloramphenicol resistance-like MFS transporter
LTRAPLWLLALFTLSGTLGMHIFVPALTLAGASLGAGMNAMQLTVSVYVIGLAIGQLAYGPIADRFGRRPTLIGGLVVYSVSSLAASIASSIELLILARLFQALGGCAGLVLARAIVRDTSGPGEAVRRLNLMNLMTILGPGLSPIIGSTLASTLGWRSIFYALAALGMFNLLVCWRALPETGRKGEITSTAVLLRNYFRLARTPAFLGFAIGGGCATTSIYAYIAAAPFIFVEQLHRPAHEVGFYLATTVAGAWLGSVAATRIVHRIPIRDMILRGNALSLIAVAILLVAGLLGYVSVVLLVAMTFVFNFGASIASPAALSRAMDVNPKLIGSASGLYGFAQMAVGALCAGLVGFGSNPAIAAGAVLVGASIVAQIGFRVALGKKA